MEIVDFVLGLVMGPFAKSLKEFMILNAKSEGRSVLPFLVGSTIGCLMWAALPIILLIVLFNL